MNKILKIVLICVIVLVLCIAAGFYFPAYFAMSGIEDAANSSDEKDREDVEDAVSDEDLEKLRHVGKAEDLPADYYLDGGMHFPLIYPSDGKYMVHYTYSYKIVDAAENKFLKTVSSNYNVMTVELDFVDGKWVVCQVDEPKKCTELVRDIFSGEKAS